MLSFNWCNLSSLRKLVSKICNKNSIKYNGLDIPRKSISNVALLHREENSEELIFKFLYQNESMKFRKLIISVQKNYEPVENSMDRIKRKILSHLSRKQKLNEFQAEDIDVFLKDSLTQRKITNVNWDCLLDGVTNQNLALQINNDNYTIAYNYPSLEIIKLPTVVSVGFDCYPSKLKINFGDLSDCSFEWFKKLPKDKKWIKCNEDSCFYSVQQDDIGCKLKLQCIVQRNGIVTSKLETNTSKVISMGPDISEIKKRNEFTSKFLPDNQIRVVSYNLLADFYSDSDYSRTVLFPYCPPEALAISYRKLLHTKEIMGYNSDLICLQEVDEDVFEQDFQLQFNRIGLNGCYFKKGGVNEGLAIFYNSHKLSLLTEHNITLADELGNNSVHGELNKKIDGNEILSARLQQLRTIAQVKVFKMISSGKHLLLINTHLYSQPNANHIRALQSIIMLQHIQDIFAKTLRENNLTDKQLPIIICGDFNSMPTSAVYKLMTKGEVQTNHEDFKNENQCLENISMAHSFRFQSAYDNPKYTNFTADFNGCLDYTFYQNDKLQIIQTVPLPSEDVLKENIAIPSIKFPSDHLALVSDFKWIN